MRVSAALGTHLDGNKPTHHVLLDADRKQVGECMRRSGPDLKNAVLRHFAVAGLALLIGSGGVFARRD